MAIDANTAIERLELDDSQFLQGAQRAVAAAEKIADATEKMAGKVATGAANAFDRLDKAVSSSQGALNRWRARADEGERAMQMLIRAENDFNRAIKAGEATIQEKERILEALWQQTIGAADAAKRHAAAMDEERRAAAAAREIEQLAAANDNLRAKYVPLHAAQQRYIASLSEIRRAEAAGVLSRQEAATAIRQQQAAYTQQARALSGAAQTTQAASGQYRQLGNAVQQAGFQVGDFAVQVASGQGVLRPFIQQGTQLVSMFGPWGAVIGAAGAVVGALAVSFLDLGDAADAAERATEIYDDAVGAVDDTIRRATESGKALRSGLEDESSTVDDLTRHYAKLSVTMREVEAVRLTALGNQTREAIAEQRSALDGLLDGVEDAAELSRRMTEVGGQIPGGLQQSEDVLRMVEALDAFKAAAPDDIEAIARLAVEMDRVAKAGGPFADEARKAADALADPATQAVELADKLRLVEANMAVLQGTATEAQEALLNLGDGAAAVTKEAKLLSDAIKLATEAAEDERKAREDASDRAQKLLTDRDNYLSSVDREIQQNAMLAASISEGARERAVVSKQIEIMNSQTLIGASAARQLAERIVDSTRALEREKNALELRNRALERATELADAETKARMAASDRAKALINERDTYLAGQEREIRQQDTLTEAVARGEHAYRVAAQAIQIMNANTLVGQAEATELAERIIASEDAFNRVKDASDEVVGFLSQAFERVGAAITEAFVTGERSAIKFGDIARGIASEVVQWFIKLSAINPLKNALVGGGVLPTLGSVAGSIGTSAGGSALGSIFGGPMSGLSSAANIIAGAPTALATNFAMSGMGASLGLSTSAATAGVIEGGIGGAALVSGGGGSVLTGAGAALSAAAPYIAAAVAAGALLFGSSMFGPNPSVGPTGVARLPGVIGRSPLELTTDNGGSSAQVEAVAKQIRDVSTAASEALDAFGSRAFGLDIGGFASPQKGSGQKAGFNLKEILDGVLADEDTFKGLSAEEAVTEGVRLTLQKAFDGFNQDEVSTALQNSAAKTVEELLKDLDFANAIGTFLDGGIEAVQELQRPLTGVEQAFKDLAKATEEGKEKADELGLSVEAATGYFAALRDKLVETTQESFNRRIREAQGEGIYNVIDDLLTQRSNDARDATAAGLNIHDTAGTLFDANLRSALSGASLADLGRILSSGEVIDAGATAILNAILNEQALAAVRETELSGLEALRVATERFGDAANDNARTLRQAAQSLLVDPNLSPLSPELRLQEARRQFEAAFGLANDNDPTDEASQDAIQRLPGLSQTMLEASKAYYGSTEGYLADFNRAQSYLNNTAHRQEDIGQQQLTALRDIEQAILDAGGSLAGMTPAQRAASQGFNFGHNPAQNQSIYNALVAAGLPTPQGFGGGVSGNLGELRAANPAVDALLRSMGFATGGSFTVAGPAGNDNLLMPLRLTAGEAVNIHRGDTMGAVVEKLGRIEARMGEVVQLNRALVYENNQQRAELIRTRAVNERLSRELAERDAQQPRRAYGT